MSSIDKSYVINHEPLTRKELEDSRVRLRAFMDGFTPAPRLTAIIGSTDHTIFPDEK
jgi:hypothetical protein